MRGPSRAPRRVPRLDGQAVGGVAGAAATPFARSQPVGEEVGKGGSAGQDESALALVRRSDRDCPRPQRGLDRHLDLAHAHLRQAAAGDECTTGGARLVLWSGTGTGVTRRRIALGVSCEAWRT